MSDLDLVSVYNSYDIMHVEVIKAALEGEGIRCVIDSESQAGLVNAMEVQLMVAEKAAPAAREFIEAHDMPVEATEEEEED